ncbi:MAG TPA: SMP-30/gluconolactonase/LRE family protein, partial [Solirubrobacteraceae bacterium]
REALYADLTPALAGTPNDMIIDGEGRAFVGDMGFDLTGPRKRRCGRVVCVSPEGDARAVAEELDYPNGIAVSADGRTLVVAETDGGCVSVFSVARDGSLHDRARIGDFGAGAPDGICLDASGAIWVSLFQDGQFVRMNRDGRVLERVAARRPRAVACVLGGPERSALYCVSAETSLTDLMAGRSTAGVDIVDAPYPGAGVP